MRLVWLETKLVLRSLIFWLVLVAFIALVYSQLPGESDLEKPMPAQENYGTKIVTTPEVVYPQLMADLIESTKMNHFVHYPFGFFRVKQLNDRELQLMIQLIEQRTGRPFDDWTKLSPAEQMLHLEQSIPSQDELELFQRQISSLVGLGASFSQTELYAQTERSYEEALHEYDMIAQSGYSISLARLFSDYAGIFISLLAWFIPLGLWYRDARPAIRETLFVKRISTKQFFWSRLFASVGPLMIGVLAFFGFYLMQWVATYGLSEVALIKPLLLVLVWLLPIVLLMAATSTLLTILTNSPMAGPIGVLAWYLINLTSSGPIMGQYGWRLIPRHNTLLNEAYFKEHLGQLLINRAVWMVVALLVSTAALYLLERKRSGAYDKPLVFRRKSRV